MVTQISPADMKLHLPAFSTAMHENLFSSMPTLRFCVCRIDVWVPSPCSYTVVTALQFTCSALEVPSILIHISFVYLSLLPPNSVIISNLGDKLKIINS